MSPVIGSGLAFPLGVDQRGAIALTRADAEIEQAIKLILGTAPGERPMRPEFGCEIHDLIFDTIDAAMVGTMETAIRRSLDRWEPRVEVESVDVKPDAYDSALVHIYLTYRVRATNDRRNLVFPFYTIPDDESDY